VIDGHGPSIVWPRCRAALRTTLARCDMLLIVACCF
jgi:hypothetical protein